MKEPNWEKCTEEQLWKYVAVRLAKNGIDTILVGGAVVSIYSEGAYHSGDLDLVVLNYLNNQLPEVMHEIGFNVSHSRHYSHPMCKHLIIDFVSGPPGIGDDLDIRPAKIKVSGTTIKLYSPTDCIRDRLASYIHFKALECLDQAVLVGLRHPFDRSKLKRWCTNEGSLESFIEFESRLKKANKDEKKNTP